MLLVHADNLSCCDYREFIDFHNQRRPINAFMTMMTFVCPNPSLCGVVELDNSGIVTGFFEKVEHPPGDISNGAVYILEPEVIEWIANNDVYDFSLHVIPNWIGKISTWMNNGVHRDIGNIEMLVAAQKDECDYHVRVGDVWEEEFKSHKIHQLLADEVNNK